MKELLTVKAVYGAAWALHYFGFDQFYWTKTHMPHLIYEDT